MKTEKIENNPMINYAIELMVNDQNLNWIDAIKEAKEKYEKFFDKVIDQIRLDKFCLHNNTIDIIADNIYQTIKEKENENN